MRGLPQQESRQSLLAAGANDEIRVRLPAGVEVLGDVVSVEQGRDLFERGPLLGVLLQQPAHRVSDLAAAAVTDRDVEEKTRLVAGLLLRLLQHPTLRSRKQVGGPDRMTPP